MKALVTGATGFIGAVLCRDLKKRSVYVRAATRSKNASPAADETFVIGDIDAATDWSRGLDDIDTVFHLAGHAHQFGAAARSYDVFRRVNVEATAALAQAAAARGVGSFVFLSSAKVNGDVESGRPFREDDRPRPAGPYARSKWDAEQTLRDMAGNSDMVITVVRPPLVYGPGVKANFLKLMRLVDRRIPLPFGRVSNARSLVYVSNLCDALIAVSARKDRSTETFFVSDADDVSTPELIRRIAASLHLRPRLLNVSPKLLRFAAALVRKQDAADRLLGSLRVDTSKIARFVGWKPQFSMADGLNATADWYRQLRA